MQILIRMTMPRQADMIRKVVGSNPGAGPFFSHEVSAEVNLYGHLAVEYVRTTCERCIMY